MILERKLSSVLRLKYLRLSSTPIQVVAAKLCYGSRNSGINQQNIARPHLGLLPYNRSFSSSSFQMKYWDYSKQYGPSSWGATWRVGQQQSPIDILRKEAVYSKELSTRPLVVDESGVDLHLINLGVNVAARPDENTSPLLVSGGPLQSHYDLRKQPNYQFREIHFHWGRRSDILGSEHAIDGVKYSAELHIVHWNQDRYKTVTEALPNQMGLSVMGVFLDEGDHPPNPALDELLDLFDQVPYKDDEYISKAKFNPYSMLPQTRDRYFTYYGSLTTPPLAESVTWIVFEEPMLVSHSQMGRFRQLKAVTLEDKDKPDLHDPFGGVGCMTCCGVPNIGDNFRDVMPVNGRQVLSSFVL